MLGYTGRLMLVDGDDRLTVSDLEYTSGLLTLAVFGTLSIDPAIPAQLLFEKIGRIHNFGLIEADPGQCGALKAKLCTANGEIEERGLAETDTNAESGLVIGNIDYLKL